MSTEQAPGRIRRSTAPGDCWISGAVMADAPGTGLSPMGCPSLLRGARGRRRVSGSEVAHVH
ncbi:hypothetical protein GCM10010521_19160 [Streptomyces rameus]|uniref:Uncharacterized protein n=1 Tax=Streptomyces rameus TaxID=68261 RepID=A0ABP6N282_9ACTN